MDISLNKGFFFEIENLMIENEKELITSASVENKDIPLQVNEVYDKDNKMKELPNKNASVKNLNKFVSDIANSIKLFSTHFTNYAHCPAGNSNEDVLKEKADYQLEQTKKLYAEYTKNLASYEKPIAEQIYNDMFAVAVKEHPQITMVSTDGSNIGLCGSVKKSVSNLVADIKLKQQETREQNAFSWFVDEMYDYIINGDSTVSSNAKQFITQYTTNRVFIDNHSLPESQLNDGDFTQKANEITYRIRNKKYSFKDETSFTNFMSTRAKYFDSIMQNIKYTDLANLNGVGTTDFHYEEGEQIMHTNPKISYNYSEDYKTYIAIEAYSANRNLVLTEQYENDRGFVRDGIFKYEV